MKNTTNKRQQGLYLVEFTIISALFLLTVFTVIDMARVFYMLNAASEITRYGARVAAVCDLNDPDIKGAMIQKIASGSGTPFVSSDDISITYMPQGCDQSNCQLISVSLSNVVISTIIGVDVNVPNYLTTLPRESMISANNAICA